MTVEQDMQAFGTFNIAQATASLWVFKKRPVTGQMNPFTAVSVVMSDTFRDQLKELARSYQTSHTIADEYSLLSQPSEGGGPCNFSRTNSVYKSSRTDRPTIGGMFGE